MAWRYKQIEWPDGVLRYKAVNCCDICKTEFIALNPNTTKYCPECRKTVRAQQNRDRVRRFRERQKKAI